MPSTFDAISSSQRLVVATATALVAATGSLYASGTSKVAVFFIAALGLAALAELFGEAIEQVGHRVGPGPTGLLQSSLGNVPELLFAVFALRAGLNSVVQAALVGSVLGNVLLVLGAAFLSGGMRHGTQRFAPEAPRMLVTLLTLAAASALVPTLASKLGAAAHHTTALSDAAAVVLLLVYIASIPFWLSGGPPQALPAQAVAGGGSSDAPTDDMRPGDQLPERQQKQSPGQGHEPPLRQPRMAGAPKTLWPLSLAIALLTASAVGSGAVSSWFVTALVPATRSLGISTTFTGLVIVAVASNAVENVAGIRFAWRARPDYAISTILNSPLQITLFLMPVLVLASSFIGPEHLTFVFPPLLLVAFAVAVAVVGVVVYDGEYSWLEGVALLALYAVIAAAFWWG